MFLIAKNYPFLSKISAAYASSAESVVAIFLFMPSIFLCSLQKVTENIVSRGLNSRALHKSVGLLTVCTGS